MTVLMLLVGIGRVAADTPLSELPLHVTDPVGETKGMVVLWSGDGGWSGTMRAIADALAERGFGVVGVNSLRYFWHEQAPEIMAVDNDRLVDHFAERWQTDTVILAGYSFGADMLPFSWPLTRQDTRDRANLIALLSPFPKAEFQITFLAMVGIIRGQHDVSAAIAALPPERVLCIAGEQETDVACAPSQAYDFVTVPGGHRYQGNMALVADHIIGALQ